MWRAAGTDFDPRSIPVRGCTATRLSDGCALADRYPSVPTRGVEQWRGTDAVTVPSRGAWVAGWCASIKAKVRSPSWRRGRCATAVPRTGTRWGRGAGRAHRRRALGAGCLRPTGCRTGGRRGAPGAARARTEPRRRSRNAARSGGTECVTDAGGRAVPGTPCGRDASGAVRERAPGAGSGAPGAIGDRDAGRTDASGRLPIGGWGTELTRSSSSPRAGGKTRTCAGRRAARGRALFAGATAGRSDVFQRAAGGRAAHPPRPGMGPRRTVGIGPVACSLTLVFVWFRPREPVHSVECPT